MRVSTAAKNSIRHLFNFDTKQKTVITLVAAAAANSTAEHVNISCNCRTVCKTKKCVCYKNDVRCSIYCHAEDDHSCINLSDLADITESRDVARSTIELQRSKRRRID